MISNQILQNTIEGLKGITRIDFCVMDTDGKSLASTFSGTGELCRGGYLLCRIPGRQSGRSRDISSLRSLMSSSLSMFCWQAERAKMSTCWVRSQRSRFRVFW